VRDYVEKYETDGNQTGMKVPLIRAWQHVARWGPQSYGPEPKHPVVTD